MIIIIMPSQNHNTSITRYYLLQHFSDLSKFLVLLETTIYVFKVFILCRPFVTLSRRFQNQKYA